MIRGKRWSRPVPPGTGKIAYRADDLSITRIISPKGEKMARLKGKKGIDKGNVVHVHDSLAAGLIESGDYEAADLDPAEGQEDHGVLQEWGSDDDYSVHGRREASYDRHAKKA